jgi:serine/threonine protein kinase
MGFADGESYCPKCGAERELGSLKQADELGRSLRAGTILHGDYSISGFFKKGAAAIYTAKFMKSGNAVLIEESGLDHAAGYDSTNLKLPASRNSKYCATAVSHLSLKEKADLLGNLAHPGFPSLSDHFIEDSNEYLVMELPRGKNLSQLAAQGAIAYHISLVAIIKLCIFLEGVHNFQYVHLDIVPENVYISDEYVYLFPFTRVQKEGAHGNGYLTTDGFSAPECHFSG